jgi:hypothetical protein
VDVTITRARRGAAVRVTPITPDCLSIRRALMSPYLRCDVGTKSSHEWMHIRVGQHISYVRGARRREYAMRKEKTLLTGSFQSVV